MRVLAILLLMASPAMASDREDMLDSMVSFMSLYQAGEEGCGNPVERMTEVNQLCWSMSLVEMCVHAHRINDIMHDYSPDDTDVSMEMTFACDTIDASYVTLDPDMARNGLLDLMLSFMDTYRRVEDRI